MTKHRWDYIIVGGGSAGAVLASRLSEDPSCSVLLLEAGGSGRSLLLRMPAGIYVGRASPKLHWFMPIERDPTRNDRHDMAVAGRGLGGGSSVNGMIFLKGLAHDYASWEASAGRTWSLDEVERAYRRVETTLGIAAPSPMHPVAGRFLEACRTYGLGLTSDDLRQTGPGVMPTPANAAGGVRQSTAYAYLGSARHRKNLTIKTHCEARKILIRNKKAYGICYQSGGRVEEAFGAEVVLAAGALKSPQLLMLSGIGPADHLMSVGIDPVHDNPAVGLGLQDHPAIWITTKVSERTWSDQRKPWKMAQAGMQWLLNRSGPAASPLSHVTGYGSTGRSGDAADYQLIFVPVGYDVRGDGASFVGSSSVTASVSVCRPSGRGSVRLRSDDPLAPPRIEYRLLGEGQDLEILIDAGEAIRKIFAEPSMIGIVRDEVSPGRSVLTRDEWRAYVRQNAVGMCHPCGTCRMGADDGAVVDPTLKLIGIDGVRIADASIMPNITSGNTNAPAIMIGERAADFMMNVERSSG